MKKRVISALVASLMVVSTLAGCGNSETQSSAVSSETNKESDATEIATSETVVEEDGPLFKDPVELSIMYSVGSTVTGEDLVLNKILELTNVKADLIQTTGDGHLEKLNSTLASGELPDIVYLQDDSQMNTWISEGALLPLDDLIAEYGPNIQAAVGDDEWRELKNLDDGLIYGLPYMLKIPAQYAWGIRQDWLDELGLKMPTDLKSLEEVLTAFKDNAAKLGVENLIPMVANQASAIGSFGGLSNAFGFITSGENFAWTLDENGNYISIYEHSNYEAFLETAARWYQNGLIDPEYLSRKNADIHKIFNAGLVGCGFVYSTRLSTYTTAIQEIDPNGYVEYMEPIVGYDGKQLAVGRSSVGSRACITIAAKDKAIECIKFLDFFYSEEGDRVLNYGIEGLSYEMVNDKPVMINEYKDGWDAVRQIGGVGTSWAYNRNLDAYYQCMLYGKSVEECEPVDLLTYRAYNGNEPHVMAPLRSFSTATSKAKGTEIYAMLSEAQAKVIEGSMTIEGFRDVLAKAKANGLDAMTAEMQACWDKIK